MCHMSYDTEAKTFPYLQYIVEGLNLSVQNIMEKADRGILWAQMFSEMEQLGNINPTK